MLQCMMSVLPLVNQKGQVDHLRNSNLEYPDYYFIYYTQNEIYQTLHHRKKIRQ